MPRAAFRKPARVRPGPYPRHMIDDPGWWIGVALGVVTLVVAYLAYRSQRGRTRLEYAVTTTTEVLPGRVASDLEVRHGGQVVEDPALTILRIVNTGDRAIKAADFETDLVVTLKGVREIASASWTASRPADLRPDIEIDGDSVRVKQALINPEDMLELQVLSAGKARETAVGGRVANVGEVRRVRMPYPPGSGREGEMISSDKLVWFVFFPVVLALFTWQMFFNHDTGDTAQLIATVAAGTFAVTLYPLLVRHLIRRRRMWRS